MRIQDHFSISGNFAAGLRFTQRAGLASLLSAFFALVCVVLLVQLEYGHYSLRRR